MEINQILHKCKPSNRWFQNEIHSLLRGAIASWSWYHLYTVYMTHIATFRVRYC